MPDRDHVERERAIEAEAIRRYGGVPVSAIESMEFHLLKAEIREEWRGE